MANKNHRFVYLFFPFLGFGSLIWFLVRVIPKPSRAAYPCMRVAAPLASTFIVWFLGIGASFLFLKKARSYFLHSRNLVATACIAAAGVAGGIIISSHHSPAFAALKTDSPIGEAKGANPGRVVWVHDSNATNWAGLGDGHWWESNHTNQAVVDQMMSRAVRALGGKTSDAEAWDTLFRYFNATHGRGNNGYAAGEKIAIKANFVQCIFRPEVCSVDTTTYNLFKWIDYPNTAPQVIRALLRQLVNVVGVNQSDISVGDPICYYPNEYYDSCHAEFTNVNYIDYGGKFGRTKAEFSSVPLYWSCRPTGVTQDYVPRHYAEATYVINLATMKIHGMAGATLCAKNHFGSLIRTPDAAGYYNLHTSVANSVPQNGSYRVFVDLMGYAHLGGKTVLCLIDALYAGSTDDSVPYKWSAVPFNNHWTSSLFASQDQVAIESVIFDVYQLDNDSRQYPKMAGVEDHLVEAAQANDPPSGTFYDPNHETNTERLPSLGVFEHWNDSVDRKYSRNLGTGNGIELIFIDGTTNSIRPSNYSGRTLKSAYSLRALAMSGTVELYIPRSGEVRLSIFDSRGRLLGKALDGYMATGSYRVEVSFASGKCGPLPSGSYIIALYRKQNSETHLMASCVVPIIKR